MKVSSHFLYHLSLSLFPSLNFSLLWHFAQKICDALASIPTIRNHSPHNLIPDFLYQLNCLAIIPIIQANTVLLIFISALFISVHEFRPMAGHIAELPFLIGKRFSALRYKSHLTPVACESRYAVRCPSVIAVHHLSQSTSQICM